MLTKPFDDSRIDWHPIPGFAHITYHILRIDEEKSIIDVLFKFDANSKIALHRHKADYCTLVLQGELRIYDSSGKLKEVRPVGSFVCARGDGDPHTEGGGDEDAIVYFSNRNVTNLVYDILDPDLNVIATLGLSEFKALQSVQKPQSSTLL